MRIVVTGADGFLGWHTRCRLRALTSHDVVAVGRRQLPRLGELMRGADAVIHLAGVNRATTDEVECGNIDLAQTVIDAIDSAAERPLMVYANSTQAGNGTPYGNGKHAAADLLAESAERVGVPFVDVLLPNLFGEHGRPGYNSFVATFAHAVVAGVAPSVTDRDVELLHVQAAAQTLLGALESACPATLRPRGTEISVAEVLDKLRAFDALYAVGDIPPLTTELDVDLFNTLRAAIFPGRYPIKPPSHSDARGNLVECVRSHGGQGQTFVSTTRPGVTRGEHFHFSKVERFVVLQGRARIALRRLLTDDEVSFDVCGDSSSIVDMPTLWAHKITNTGSEDLLTLCWTHTVFDPQAPDTYAELVCARG